MERPLPACLRVKRVLMVFESISISGPLPTVPLCISSRTPHRSSSPTEKPSACTILTIGPSRRAQLPPEKASRLRGFFLRIGIDAPPLAAGSHPNLIRIRDPLPRIGIFSCNHDDIAGVSRGHTFIFGGKTPGQQ